MAGNSPHAPSPTMINKPSNSPLTDGSHGLFSAYPWKQKLTRPGCEPRPAAHLLSLFLWHPSEIPHRDQSPALDSGKTSFNGLVEASVKPQWGRISLRQSRAEQEAQIMGVAASESQTSWVCHQEPSLKDGELAHWNPTWDPT